MVIIIKTNEPLHFPVYMYIVFVEVSVRYWRHRRLTLKGHELEADQKLPWKSSGRAFGLKAQQNFSKSLTNPNELWLKDTRCHGRMSDRWKACYVAVLISLNTSKKQSCTAQYTLIDLFRDLKGMEWREGTEWTTSRRGPISYGKSSLVYHR